MEASNTSEFMVLGDFTADNGNNFFWRYHLLWCNIAPGNFVHTCQQWTLTCSWIEYYISSQTVHGSIRQLSIYYNYYDSEHLPLTLSLDYPCLNVSIPESGTENRMKGTFSEESKVDRLYRLVYLGMRQSFSSPPICDRQYCADASHKLA